MLPPIYGIRRTRESIIMKIAKHAASYAPEELLNSIGERLILRDSIMSIAAARFVMANYKLTICVGWPPNYGHIGYRR